MSQLRLVLICMTVLIVVFTVTAVAQGGFDLITPFLAPIIAMTWPGQFHVDFLCYLVLSGIWMAWRQGFSNSGIALGVLAPPLGILFFAPYLIYLIHTTERDALKMIMGVHADG